MEVRSLGTGKTQRPNLCIEKVTNLVNITGSVGDFGGGNGIIKEFIPLAVTVDNDATKCPDIVADILTYNKYYDTVILRYVLHYLTDLEVLELLTTINAKQILVIQFVNENLGIKYKNSISETKYFRCKQQLQGLLPKNNTKLLYEKEYTVTKEFYVNRLQNVNGTEHQETLVAYLVTRE